MRTGRTGFVHCVHKYLNMESQKLSTSRNWATWTPDLLERYDPDPVRYYLTAIAPEARDTNFTWRAAHKPILLGDRGN